jgi:hypothetical protein
MLAKHLREVVDILEQKVGLSTHLFLFTHAVQGDDAICTPA